LRRAGELGEAFSKVQTILLRGRFRELTRSWLLFVVVALAKLRPLSRLATILRLQHLALANDILAAARKSISVGHPVPVFNLNDGSRANHFVHLVDEAPDASLGLDVKFKYLVFVTPLLAFFKNLHTLRLDLLVIHLDDGDELNESVTRPLPDNLLLIFLGVDLLERAFLVKDLHNIVVENFAIQTASLLLLTLFCGLLSAGASFLGGRS
jgi:hypothetical protein